MHLWGKIFDSNPNLFKVSFLESTMEIPKMQKLILSHVLKK